MQSIKQVNQLIA